MAKYPDLKSYLQANYIDLFTSEIQKFVDGCYHRAIIANYCELPRLLTLVSES